MPQGFSGALATFQRLMENTVGDMNLIEVLVHLDDIIVVGKILEEHEAREKLNAEGPKPKNVSSTKPQSSIEGT